MVYMKTSGLKFTIIGEGNYEEEIAKLIKSLGLNKVVSLINKKIPQDEIPNMIKNADLGIVSYSCLNTIFSNKFLEYIAMGIPTLMAFNKHAYNYYKKYNLEFYNREDPSSFAERLYYLYKDRKRYNELKQISVELSKRFKWSKEKRKYINLVEQLIDE